MTIVDSFQPSSILVNLFVLHVCENLETAQQSTHLRAQILEPYDIRPAYVTNAVIQLPKMAILCSKLNESATNAMVLLSKITKHKIAQSRCSVVIAVVLDPPLKFARGKDLGRHSFKPFRNVHESKTLHEVVFHSPLSTTCFSDYCCDYYSLVLSQVPQECYQLKLSKRTKGSQYSIYLIDVDAMPEYCFAELFLYGILQYQTPYNTRILISQVKQQRPGNEVVHCATTNTGPTPENLDMSQILI